MHSASEPLISIVLVCWNSSTYLPRCLESLSNQTFQNFEVIVVDNGSVEDATQGLKRTYPQLDLKTERLTSNLGFARANNRGAEMARGIWLVLLNTDAFPEPGWLAQLLAASDAHPKASSFSSRQLLAGNPEFLDGIGDTYHVSGLAWRLGRGYPADRYGLTSSEIFSPCAAAAMYRREAFLEVGGFDERFFSYFEDVDLGFRLQLRGYRSYYVAEAVVHHVGSATFGERSDFAFYHSHRNMVWTYVKNMPLKMFWWHLPAHLLANLIYLLYYTFRGRGKVLWQAKRDAILGLSKTLRDRRTIQKNRSASDRHLANLMEHGWLRPYLWRYSRILKNEPGESP